MGVGWNGEPRAEADSDPCSEGAAEQFPAAGTSRANWVPSGDNSTGFTPGTGSIVAGSAFRWSEAWGVDTSAMKYCISKPPVTFSWMEGGKRGASSPHDEILQQTSLMGLGRDNNTKIRTLLLPPPSKHLPHFLFSLPFSPRAPELRGFLGTVTSFCFELGICMLQRKPLHRPYLVCPNMISVRL